MMDRRRILALAAAGVFATAAAGIAFVLVRRGAPVVPAASVLEPAPAPAAAPPVASGSDAPAAPAAADAPADLAPPGWESDALKFEVVLPEAPPGDPVILALRQDADQYLKRMRVNADASRAVALRERRDAPRWDVQVSWAYTAKAGGLVSLKGEASEYTGGAHPLLYFDSHIAWAETGQEVTLEEMIGSRNGFSPALTVGACEALRQAKLARTGADTVFEEPLVCAGPGANAKLEEATVALAPSDVPDRFGGLYVYITPYTVGPYVEGAYTLTVQQEVFAADLKPQFRELFAGVAPVVRD